MNINIQIEQWPIERLRARTTNPRTHSDRQVVQLSASILEFGWTNPILVGADGDIIAGHARLQAAQKLEMREVPVIVLGHLSEAQRRALVIADNQLALNAGWDEHLLRLELAALQEEDFNVELIGFEDEELRRLLAAQDASQGDEDAVAEIPETPVTRLGDVWLLGGLKRGPQHRIICADSTAGDSVLRLLEGQKPPLIMVTDPPYGVDLDPEWREEAGLNPRTRQGGKVSNDDRVDFRGIPAIPR